MPRHRPSSRLKSKQATQPGLKPPNVLQTNRGINESIGDDRVVEELSNIKSLLIDDAPSILNAGTSSATIDDDMNTASLHNELDSFRQRWKRELEVKSSDVVDVDKPAPPKSESEEKENRIRLKDLTTKEFYAAISNPPEDSQDVYALAKRLFLIGVRLEQDELHHESIRYYKQAMHLYPDIERQIYREQNEASVKLNNDASSHVQKSNILERSIASPAPDDGDRVPLVQRLVASLNEESNDGRFAYCRKSKQKLESLHMSDLPHDLLLQIFRYVIGQELDLASLEILGLVCRGFYLLSRDNSLWRSVCHRTWGNKMLETDQDGSKLDWRQIYLDRPRVNFDGIYISRTRYIRQGDVGFQDMTYRPFHVVFYYRYLRFFPDRRVLVLTTNEEPDRIIPIFRNALHARQFSPELSTLEGTYDLIDNNILVISAEKDFTAIETQIQKRFGRLQWSRRTPFSQKFDFKFELKTSKRFPHRNNILKWKEYSITSKLETGQEMTDFDLDPDLFPNLIYKRVKTFNLKQSEPLSSH